MQSLAVGNSEVEGQSRITMVIPGSAEGTSKIIKQLNKLVHVQQVGTCCYCISSMTGLMFFFPNRKRNIMHTVHDAHNYMACAQRLHACLLKQGLPPSEGHL